MVTAVSPSQNPLVVFRENKHLAVDSDRLTGLTARAVGRVDKLARAPVTLSQQLIREGWIDRTKWHPQRQTSCLARQVWARFGFVDDDDIVLVARCHTVKETVKEKGTGVN
jgi:hypothetical protein